MKLFQAFWQCSGHLRTVLGFLEPFQADWYMFTDICVHDQVQAYWSDSMHVRTFMSSLELFSAHSHSYGCTATVSHWSNSRSTGTAFVTLIFIVA